jgi:hypothetical protein
VNLKERDKLYIMGVRYKAKGLVAVYGKKRNPDSNLVGTPENKIPLGKKIGVCGRIILA